MRLLIMCAGRAVVAIAICLATAGISVADPPPSRAETVDLQSGLLMHLPLAGDAGDRSTHKRPTTEHGAIDWRAAGPHGRDAAGFNGRDAMLEVPAAAAPQIGRGDFTVAVWINNETLDDVPGDIVSQYDPQRRRGFHLTLKTNAGVTTTQANYRQLQFGIDDDRASEWVDCGRPGNAILAFALATYDGQLYAGTCEPGKDEAGRVYRYGGDRRWIDCGAPAACNAVTALAEFDGKLYAGVGKYRLGGSALDESENPHLGGRVFRYEGGTRWTDCGQLPDVEAVGGIVTFGGKLYASSLYRPAGFFCYEGGSNWTALPTPGVRVEAMGIYNGFLYATSYDVGRVFRFDGTNWRDCGLLGETDENTQTYSLAVHAGRLYAGTWPSGRVYRFEEIGRWSDAGRLGTELEVMGMLVHNGRLLAGTLPLAEVYSYEGGTVWRRLARLDHTPEVRYRRAWTMAEFDGRVFCSTLPSGRIYAFEAGVSATADRSLEPGWRHVAAVKSQGSLRLFVDGRLLAHSRAFAPDAFDLCVDEPLRIGMGANDYFCGRLADLRVYGRALTSTEVARLAAAP